jgi:hypothetical protein
VLLRYNKKGTNMRFRTILTLATLLPTVFAVAGWWEPRAPQPTSCLYRAATQSGSVSGKISAVGGASFSVDVQKSQEPVTLKFLIDDHTKIDGKLQVGSTATVDYRTEEVNNIAVRVVVLSAAYS